MQKIFRHVALLHVRRGRTRPPTRVAQLAAAGTISFSLQAHAQQRFVLLDLEAIWCHWCHVMDETTYQDRAVRQLIAQKYIAVSVDQDSDPALAARYQDYGWPATIVLAADGTEIVKRRGYLPPAGDGIACLPPSSRTRRRGLRSSAAEEVQPARSAVLDEWAAQGAHWQPTSRPTIVSTPAGERAEVHRCGQPRVRARAREGAEPRQAAMARNTLDAATALIDPVWGGVYQYSDRRDWQSPHFEKIMSFQTQYVRLYAEGYRVLGDARFPESGTRASIVMWRKFLTSADGAVLRQPGCRRRCDSSPAMCSMRSVTPSGAAAATRASTRMSMPARTAGRSRALAALYDATGDARYLGRAQPRGRLGDVPTVHSARRVQRTTSALPRRRARRHARDGAGVPRALCLERRARDACAGPSRRCDSSRRISPCRWRLCHGAAGPRARPAYSRTRARRR